MKKIKIGLAGLGTVGSGVYNIIQKDAKLLTTRTGVEFEIIAASSRSKKDFLDSKIKFYNDPIDLANNSEIDVLIEVIGGSGIAKNIIELALKNGKKVITANKSLISEHGFSLAELSEKHDSYIGFEASVAGAAPIIKIFKDGLSANEIKEFYAILNGTSNFILTKMKDENLSFADALKIAQELGYAESDPTFDIKGIDTSHKLSILAAIASGSKPSLNQTYIEGIDEISIDDINLATELGYKIKLLAIYKNCDQDSCKFASKFVYPALIKSSEKISSIDGAFNAILSNSSNAGHSFVVGSGAGSLPTASAIIADLIDIASKRYSSFFGVESAKLKNENCLDISNRSGKYFLRFLSDKKLPISNYESMILKDKIKIEKSIFIDSDRGVLCGFITNSQKESNILSLDFSTLKSFKFIRVEETNF